MLILMISLLVLQLLLTSTAVGFTSQSSVLRLALLPVMVLVTWNVLTICTKPHAIHVSARTILGAGSVYRIIHYIAVALLDCWTYEAQGPTSSLGGLEPVLVNVTPQSTLSWDHFGQRIRFGARISTTTRFPTTRWRVKNVPPFSRSNPDHVPSKHEFVWHGAIQIIRLACVLGVATPFSQWLFRTRAHLFSPSHVPLFARIAEVTPEELAVRALGVLIYWTMQYLSLSLLYNSLAVTTVALQIFGPEEWPPIFGAIDQAWSIAQFWGCFYHQNIRRSCSSIAHFFTYHILPFRKGTIVGRYAFITLVFAISGVFHHLADIARMPEGGSAAVQFFLMQPLGIGCERILQTLYGLSTQLSFVTPTSRKYSQLILRILGYAWVMTWIVWTSPVWIYSSVRSTVQG
ncbi:hypothetical protein AC578_3187 [Pseudocercospora eumusae]|uniref:Wax synthase domain-containing protein n=1 Tax=Pseudocercospora eumusae TaxID=321146 RepID=A0A139GWC3_9PEZI|nr:hypothetical protein AC578_3187 [Pseudocercospora eumusae]